MVLVIVSIGAPLSLDCSVVSIGPVLRQNSVRRQVLDLSAPVARRSRLNGHSPAPPASTSPDALRRPPSGRPLENLALRSEEHTSELQSLTNLVCRLLLEKKKKKNTQHIK